MKKRIAQDNEMVENRELFLHLGNQKTVSILVKKDESVVPKAQKLLRTHADAHPEERWDRKFALITDTHGRQYCYVAAAKKDRR